jgi:aspartyl-tRNA(Asn)/glutamyl-tRNA(Gln) amidotransferase subunit B
MSKSYEMVIGLEVHVELKTSSKIFCGCPTEFGKAPNTQVCPVCLGLPGSLPVLNQKVVEYAVTAGLATNCRITKVGKQDRKNYFYPDLPKAYQISQYDQPLCEEGYIEIEDKDDLKTIGITRIHIEEDAGKLIHDDSLGTLIDYNRGGVPLIEIVSEPDIRSGLQAKRYLQKLRGILLYTGISDCKMNEGSFRCDVNLSVRKKGETAFGTRTEMKNLNSFASITKAIDHEFQRQVKVLETGGQIQQETRRWDQDKNKSFSMRTKEDAHDYRYFPDPDLQPIVIDDDYLESVKSKLPELPDSRKKRYMTDYGLPRYDADHIALDLKVADFFEATVAELSAPKLIANLLIGEVLKLINTEETDIKISPQNFAKLIKFIQDGTINTAIAKKVMAKMWATNLEPAEIIEGEDLKLIRDKETLVTYVDQVILNNEKIVIDYKNGKEKALQSLMGQVMRLTGGKADPSITQEILKEKLNS